MSVLTFRVEQLRDIWRELEPLFPLHYAETGEHEGNIDVDWQTYFELERLGIVQAMIARNTTGRVSGYFIGLIRPNLHNRSQLIAMSDMYFLHPVYRGRAGLQLFREVEKAWRDTGVQLGGITCKVSRNYGRIFERLGWWLEEKVYLKRL